MKNKAATPSEAAPSKAPNKKVPVKKIQVIARAALFEQLLDALRDMIIEGELPEGSRIPEPELCEQFGTSRTPLREAFKVLASEGLIELQTFRGAFVAKISEKDASEVAFVLSTMEQAAAKVICQSASDASIAAMQDFNKKMLAAAKSGDMATYRKLNESIHAKLVELTGNSILIESYNRIKNRLLRVRHAGTRNQEELQHAITDHEDMMTALGDRNGDELAAVIARHYESPHWTVLADARREAASGN